MTHIHSYNQAKEEYNRLTGSIFRAKEYYMALTSHKPHKYVPSKFDEEINRCVKATEEGIARLERQRKEIDEIIDTFNLEIIKLS